MTNPEQSQGIDLNGIKLKNRVLWAAGVWGYGLGWPWERWLTKIIIPGYGKVVDPATAGAIVTKTLTLKPRQGGYIDPFEFERRSLMSHFCHIFPELCHILCHISSEEERVLKKVPGGWINNLQWWNVGIDYWKRVIYPQIPKNVTIIVNIGGFVIEHYTELIRQLNDLEIVAIELNISCPNVKNPLEKNPEELTKLFILCRAASRHPLIVKVGVNCDYVRVARIAEYCGLNAISAINAIPALGGAYSGKGIKPIALRVIQDLKEETKLPIIGGGGITSLRDCWEFLEIADAIALGSVGFNPLKPTWLVKKYKRRKNG